MIIIREAKIPPSYKDYIDNWSKYEKQRTPEEIMYWTRIWEEDIWKSPICKILDYQLYYVDGGQIRGLKNKTSIDLDFCLGGTFARYPWIGKDCIVIEKILQYAETQDRLAIIVHEYTELTEGLLEGMPYETAHEEKANREEARYRFDPKSSKYYPLLLDLELQKPLNEDYNYQTYQKYQDALKMASQKGYLVSNITTGIYDVYIKEGYHTGVRPIYTARSVDDLLGYFKNGMRETTDKFMYRIIRADGRDKFAGTGEDSWFTLPQAYSKVNRGAGEKILMYDPKISTTRSMGELM